MKIPCSLTLLFLSPLLANAYTWQFTSQPRQCQDLSLSISGSGGQPPYSLTIIPTGASPLPNNTEVRTILNIPFSGSSTTLSFKFNYPESSSFVAVVRSHHPATFPRSYPHIAPHYLQVSDQSGFGSGGASTSVTVQPSSDSSCYNPSQPTKFAWVFNTDPAGLTQCASVRLWWEPTYSNGCVFPSTFRNSVHSNSFHQSRRAPPCRTVSFYGTIPGGTSFAIPQASLSNTTDTGTGFNWTANIAGATNVLLIGNDDRGIGSGGSAQFSISYAGNSSCLNNNSPHSTAGSPAGGSYPTSTSQPSNSGSGSHSSSSSS
jgi:hypothetical protein